MFDSYGFTANKFKEVFLLDTSSDKFGHLNYTVSATNETAYYLHKNVVERCRNDMKLRTCMEDEYEQLLRDREQLRIIMGCRGSGSESDPFTYLPVNIDRLIWNAQRQFRIKMEEPTSLDPQVPTPSAPFLAPFLLSFLPLFYPPSAPFLPSFCPLFPLFLPPFLHPSLPSSCRLPYPLFVGEEIV